MPSRNYREYRVRFDLDDIEGEISKPLDISIEGEGDEIDPLPRLSMFVSEWEGHFEVVVYFTGSFGRAAVAAQKVAAALTKYAQEMGRY